MRMKALANQYNGMYRRYSDDFVLVIPKRQYNELLSSEAFSQVAHKVQEIATENKINLQVDKTELLEYKQNTIFNLQNNEEYRLDYLGFVFNGLTVEMRGKSPYKFYREAKKLIARAHRVKHKRHLRRLPYRKRIYGLYTDMGLERGKYGNFISYAKRAQEGFDHISPNTKNLMMNQIKNRKKKIEKYIGFNIHTKV